MSVKAAILATLEADSIKFLEVYKNEPNWSSSRKNGELIQQGIRRSIELIQKSDFKSEMVNEDLDNLYAALRAKVDQYLKDQAWQLKDYGDSLRTLMIDISRSIDNADNSLLARRSIVDAQEEAKKLVAEAAAQENKVGKLYIVETEHKDEYGDDVVSYHVILTEENPKTTLIRTFDCESDAEKFIEQLRAALKAA